MFTTYAYHNMLRCSVDVFSDMSAADMFSFSCASDSANQLAQLLLLFAVFAAYRPRARFVHPTVREHQKLHAEVESLRQQVRSGEQQVQDCARKLTEADAVLRGPLRDAKRLLEEGRKAEACEFQQLRALKM